MLTPFKMKIIVIKLRTYELQYFKIYRMTLDRCCTDSNITIQGTPGEQCIQIHEEMFSFNSLTKCMLALKLNFQMA
jgi:hypothetical protein